MYFLPAGLLIKMCARPDYWNLIHDSVSSYAAITAMGILRNLAAVTLGNMFGGSVMVGLVYSFIYLRRSNQPDSAT